MASKDLEYTMCCCSACNAPIQPSLDALRKDGIGVRAVLFIASEATRNCADWNIKQDPKILDVYNALHIFHVTNTIPVMQLFEDGRAKDLWIGKPTKHFNPSNFSSSRPTSLRDVQAKNTSGLNPRINNFESGESVPQDMISVATVSKGKFRAVSWDKPRPLEQFESIHKLIETCISNVGECRFTPDFDLTVPGCKSCNDIMTLEATSSHLLVRNEISKEPLVPLESILSIELTGTLEANNLKFADDYAGKYRWDPSESNRGKDPEHFTYQACLAYYIHRCMPRPLDFGFRSKPKQEKARPGAHTIIASMAFLFLEIAGLIFERMNGVQGGKQRLVKAAYRYRGCIELYLSHVFWILLRIDNIEGEKKGENGRHCTLDFMRFHRYVFLDVIKVLVLAEPKYAGEIEIADIVFNGDTLKSGKNYSPHQTSEIAEKRIGFIAESVASFYSKIIKPVFSRHMAGLEPDLNLIPIVFSDGDEENAVLHNKQKLTYNMLIDCDSMNRIMHVMPKVIYGEIDTIIEEVGVQAVFARWQSMLELAPRSTESLVQSFVDNEVLKEYQNIRINMRPDSFQPTISLEAAEAIFLMCTALELPSEPNSREELELLRITPKCSEMKSIERLSKVRAFKEESQMQVGAKFGVGSLE